MIQQFAQNQNVDVPEDFKTYRYSDFLGRTFKLVNAADRYQYDDAHSTWWTNRTTRPSCRSLWPTARP